MQPRKLTASDKGKGIMLTEETAPRRRTRAPQFDNSALIQRNLQTLIGRVTNPSEQSIANLLEDLPRNWTLKGRVTSSDLGQERFQFRFDRADDLQSVLNNRPYQFNGWMVILQQWEPIISPSFPSQIPFWITVKGIPLHYWHEKVIYNLGHDLGHLDNYEITDTSARIRVLLDGTKPLERESFLDFATGEEALITFEYEGLGRCCSECSRLTHATKDCPFRARHDSQRKEERASQKDARVSVNKAHTYRLESRYQPYPSPSQRSINNHVATANHRDSSFSQRLDRHGRPFGERIALPHEHVRPLRNKITPPPVTSQEQPVYGEYQEQNIRQQDQTNRPRKTLPTGAASYQQVWREKKDSPRKEQPRETPGFSTPTANDLAPLSAPIRSLERNLAISDFPAPPRIPTTEEVMQELVDVTIQYTNVADPVEKEARRQRVLQSNSEGLMEETAARIIAAAQSSLPQNAPLPTSAPIILPAPGESIEPQPPAKRRGRPPANKRQSPRPRALAGASSRKRNLSKAAPSPSGPPRSVNRTHKQSAVSSQDGSNNNQNPANVASARVDPQQDFHTREPPLP